MTSTKRVFILPGGAAVTTTSPRRYIVIYVGSPARPHAKAEVVLRTDDKAKADAYARRHPTYMVFS